MTRQAVFHGPRHRVRFSLSTKHPTDIRSFKVETLPNTAHKSASYSNGQLVYFGPNFMMAWEIVKFYAPDAQWPWEAVNTHTYVEVFQGTVALTPTLPLTVVFARTGPNGKVTYESRNVTGWIAMLAECWLAGKGGTADEALVDLKNKVDELFLAYAQLGWPSGMISSPIGDGYAPKEIKILKSMKRTP